MRRLTVFNNVTLDGYFADARGDVSWAYARPADAEWDAFVAGNAQGDGVLLLGRITYEMMASYWPAPAALAQAPGVAEGINRMQKFVFSRTLDRPSWQNTTVVKGEITTAVRAMKETRGPGIAILGSGSIVSQLAQAGLIDEYQLVVHPVVLGQGRTMFASVTERLALALTKTRSFENGTVVLWYERQA